VILTRLTQKTPQIDHPFPIHMQPPYRRSPDGRDSLNPSKVLVPAKVIDPLVTTRVEEAYHCPRLRVGRFDSVLFRAVTALAGEGQIFGVLHAATRHWQNVIYRERVRRERFGAFAVFAAPPGPLENQGAQRPGEGTAQAA